MYRADGTVRYRAAKNGQFAIMQNDGNFVEYTPFAVAVWNTGTYGNPGSFVVIQDDGNLVVYSPKGPIWDIGAEPNWETDPSVIGDVMGRDLDQKAMEWMGHLGIWDGDYVVQVMNRESDTNAVEYVTSNQFKDYKGYWGKARARIPNKVTESACYEANCWYSENKFYNLNALDALNRSAYQIYLIGSDYTFAATPTIAYPGHEYKKAQRGVYRCDTFVVDVLYASTRYRYVGPEEKQWKTRWQSMRDGVITPRRVFNSMKSFQ